MCLPCKKPAVGFKAPITQVAKEFFAKCKREGKSVVVVLEKMK